MQPGNYLTHFIDETEHNLRHYSVRDQKPLKSLLKALRSAVCFQLPLNGVLFPDDPVLYGKPLDVYGFSRPSYPLMVLEFDIVCTDNSREEVVLIVMDAPERELQDGRKGGALCIPAIRYVDGGNWKVPAFGYMLPYENLGVRETTGWKHHIGMTAVMPDAVKQMTENSGMGDKVNLFMEDMYREGTSHYVVPYLHLCAALGIHEVSFADIEPHKGRNKMRRARGQAPLFTYKILTIGKKKPKTRQLGGTHASPRSHLRRGYYRTSPKGIRHWVQPCMVKGETEGFVHKDYRVEGELV